MTRLRRPLALVLVFALAAALAVWSLSSSTRRITAYFDHAVGLYAGSDVRILGIKVGSVQSVTPQGSQVQVTFSVDSSYPVPASASAFIVAPSLVSDRYVQLAPAYSSGPTMQDGASLPLSRTHTPVELDQVYSALDQLSTALGPTGANKDAALSDLVDTGAANLQGNGAALNQTLSGFSQAVRTLSENRDALFSSLDNLQTFTSALATVNTQVAQFNQNFAATSAQLASERTDLATAINLLTKALADVATFVRQNTSLLTTNVSRLADVTLSLVQQRSALAAVLDTAPAALGNLSHAYNPTYGTLDTRDNSAASANAAVIVCEVLNSTGRLHLTGVDVKNLPALLALSPTDQVCARLLSGDPGNTGSPQDLNHNGVPDLQELLHSLFNSSAPPSSTLPGLPPVGGTP